MHELALHILFTVMRWLHLMGSTLIVGGTLFFEFVVPRAIDDLKTESQLSIIAYLRYVFRRIVWASVVVLPITGAFSAYWLWPGYVAPDGSWSPAFPWAIAHTILSFVGLALAAALVIGRAVPPKARWWMKVNFVILMAAMFIASASRHLRIDTRGKLIQQQSQKGEPPPPFLTP